MIMAKIKPNASFLLFNVVQLSIHWNIILLIFIENFPMKWIILEYHDLRNSAWKWLKYFKILPPVRPGISVINVFLCFIWIPCVCYKCVI